MNSIVIYRFVITIALLLALCGVAEADHTLLHTKATSMAPGEWGQVIGMTGLNLTANPGFDVGASAPGPGFDGGQPGWDSTAKKLYMEVTEHGRGEFCPEAFPAYPNICWKPLWTYDDATNTWTIDGPYPHDVSNNPQGAFHVWGMIAWDNTNKTLYVKAQGYPYAIFRYCASNSPATYCATQLNDWKQLPAFTPSAGDLFAQLGWLPSRNGGTLINFDPQGNNAGCGALRGYTEASGVWTDIDPGTGCKFVQPASTLLQAIPSTLKSVILFGPTGASGLQWWRLGATGAPVALDTAPCAYFTTDGGYAQAAEDSNTGNIFFFGCNGSAAGKIYKLDPTGSAGNQWTLIDNDLSSPGEICNIVRQGACGKDFYATPISTYGVIGFWKFRAGTNTAEYWLYKPSASAGDTTPPSSVVVTAPAGGSTVSGTLTPVSATATDDVGVAGVQFKLDGVNLGLEDTSSPYSIIWDTTGATNGTHIITAVARDAANNTATSSGVTVTVSNAGGSDFATRCAASGVLRCIGFETGDITATGVFGDNHDISRMAYVNAHGGNQYSDPVLDTAQKASGSSSLKMTIPSNSGADTSGNYWINFSDDLLTQFGQNTTFYVQFRMRFSSCFLFQGSAEPCTGSPREYLNSAGWKQVLLGTGDKPGCTAGTNSQTSPRLCYGSCTDLEISPTNTLSRGIVQMYQACPSNNTDLIVPFSSIYSSSDYKLQNNQASPYCLYQAGIIGGYANYFAPNGNCVPYVADEWMTFKIKVTVGTRNVDLFENSVIEFWVAREGQASVKILDCHGGTGASTSCWGNRPTRPHLYAGPASGDEGDQKYGKIWLIPYNTNKSAAETHPTTYVWYDELIISTSDIADPGVGGSTTPNAPSGFKLK